MEGSIEVNPSPPPPPPSDGFGVGVSPGLGAPQAVALGGFVVARSRLHAPRVAAVVGLRQPEAAQYLPFGCTEGSGGWGGGEEGGGGVTTPKNPPLFSDPPPPRHPYGGGAGLATGGAEFGCSSAPLLGAVGRGLALVGGAGRGCGRGLRVDYVNPAAAAAPSGER